MKKFTITQVLSDGTGLPSLTVEASSYSISPDGRMVIFYSSDAPQWTRKYEIRLAEIWCIETKG